MTTFNLTSRREVIFEELRLIERSESEVNGAWKGAHLLLFFLAFVFGSFCTFCFHMLMYLFEEKCVLFPKLLSLNSMRHNVMYEFVPQTKDKDMLPVDFVSTQWIEKSACYLPTYVPLVSGIFGLIWTTMFLMCTTGSRTLTGLQRPWRVIPPVFIFSLAMGFVCVYSSTITHSGLNELCAKLGELTNTHSCSYAVNIATLLYERKIRGVYQATRLTIISAWLHTICWLLSALLALIRILLVVDFRLVKVNVELVGDIDKMLEHNEEQLRTVSPKFVDDKYIERFPSDESTEVRFENDIYTADDIPQEMSVSNILYMSTRNPDMSTISLVPDEEHKLVRLKAYAPLPKDKQFIVKMLYDLLDSIVSLDSDRSQTSSIETAGSETDIARQFGQAHIYSGTAVDTDVSANTDDETSEPTGKTRRKRKKPLIELTPQSQDSSPRSSSSSKKRARLAFESVMNLAPEMRNTIRNQIERLRKRSSKSKEATSKLRAEDPKQSDASKPESDAPKPSTEATTSKFKKKSNLKNIAIQTEKKTGVQEGKQKVTISESRSTFIGHERDSDEDSLKSDETQTAPKEKQD